MCTFEAVYSATSGGKLSQQFSSNPCCYQPMANLRLLDGTLARYVCCLLNFVSKQTYNIK